MGERAFAWAFVLVALTGCGDAVGLGASCVDSSDCESGLGCFSGPVGEQRCMERCNPSTTWLCDDGQVCLGDGVSDADDVGACYLGGLGAAEDPCDTNLNCGFGLVCVDVDGASGFACFRACELTGDGCLTGQTCAPLNENNGFCRPDA